MGFCSGTEIFDPVVKHILADADMSDGKKEELIYILADALMNHDWDCETDSDYYINPLVRKALKRANPWDDEDEDTDDE